MVAAVLEKSLKMIAAVYLEKTLKGSESPSLTNAI